MRLRVLRTLPARNDAGATLAELVVTMAVLALPGMLALLIIGLSSSTTATIANQASSTITATTAITDMSRTLASSTISEATNRRIVAYTEQPYRCDQHTYWITAATNPVTLQHSIKTLPTGPGGDCTSIKPAAWETQPDAQSNTLITGVEPNPNGLPAFTYYSTGNSRLPAEGDTGYVTPVSPCRIARIGIQVTVNPQRLAPTDDGYKSGLVTAQGTAALNQSAFRVGECP